MKNTMSRDFRFRVSGPLMAIAGSVRTTEDIFFAGGKVGASFGLQKEAPKEAIGTYSVDGWILSFTLNGRSHKSVIFAYDPEHDGAGAPTLDFMGIKWGLDDNP